MRCLLCISIETRPEVGKASTHRLTLHQFELTYVVGDERASYAYAPISGTMTCTSTVSGLRPKMRAGSS